MTPPRRLLACVALVLGHAATLSAQAASQRGFIEVAATGYPRQAPNDRTRAIADLFAREDVFVKPLTWLQFAAGAELRANSHDQVEDGWRIDLDDRGTRRPRMAVRRLSATVTRGWFTADIGKQVIRWGKTDLVNPTDRFAPRDFLNVVDADFLGVTALRATAQFGRHTFEAVWNPRFTPSRMPLPDQRWAVVPPGLPPGPKTEAPVIFPARSQSGGRWGFLGNGFEWSLSLFDGFNHLPDLAVRAQGPPLSQPSVAIVRTYPRIRVYGADAAVPTRWLTVKGEAAYVTSPTDSSDEYLLYVVQVERQTGEWTFVGGYVGEVVKRRRTLATFAPDRGMSKAVFGSATRTIGSRRRLKLEGVVRQNGDGAYGKIEYSQTYGQHWRATISATGLGGSEEDFLGQYRHNSHATLAVRYSF